MNRKEPNRLDVLSVLEKSRRRCALCFYFNADYEIKRGQIAHINNNASQSEQSNLVFLCLKHHDEYHLNSPLTKSITEDELKIAKDKLEQWIERYHSAMLGSSALNTTTDLNTKISGVTPEIYRMRFPIYKSLNSFIANILREAKLTHKELFQFSYEMHEALFLFGNEVENYWKEVFKNANELILLENRLQFPDKLADREWENTIQKETDLLNWFANQL